MLKPRNNSPIIAVLRYIGETTPELLNLGVRAFVDPKQVAYETLLGEGYSRRTLANRISYLQRSKYFRKAKRHNAYELTSAGRAAVIRIRILDKIKNIETQWDGTYRAIGFDIAEERRRDRALLRQELRTLGLIELQHSLWVTPVDITRELLVLLRLWEKELAGDVRVFVIKEIHDDKDIRKHFRLH